MARQFGHTWWGRAWVDALENRARLDPNRLPRGRTYARHNRVSALSLAPGAVTAFVKGNRPGQYRVLVRVRTYGDTEWAAVVETIAARAIHAAALLDGDLDPSIADDAQRAGADLLPGPGDLQPRCSCPDWADPCKHAAAVCYLVADALDQDPFALFALRGRPREALLAELRAVRRRGAAASAGGSASSEDNGPAQEIPRDLGVPARDAWRAAGRSTHEARAPTVGERPGSPASWPSDPPADASFTAAGLRTLSADAAVRAWSQLRGEGTSGLELDADADLARRASIVLGRDPEFTDLARASGAAPVDLARRAIAWRHGGVDALAILSAESWRPPIQVIASARQAVIDALDPGARVMVADNRITAGPVQLRLDRSGRWWRMEKRRGRWEVAAPPADEPDDLLA